MTSFEMIIFKGAQRHCCSPNAQYHGRLTMADSSRKQNAHLPYQAIIQVFHPPAFSWLPKVNLKPLISSLPIFERRADI
jgi:hypothetical protein